MPGPREANLAVAIRAFAATVLAAIAIVASLGAAEAAASSPAETLGVYRGARNVAGVKDFESWAGHTAPHVLDFLSKESWSKIESPTWWTSGWKGSGYDVEFSFAMIPNTGGTLQAGAHGDYNSHFLALARNLVANGQANATLRPGWEFNGAWYKWSARSDPAAYAAYWRQIVTTMRSVPGQNFKFDWCAAIGPEVDIERAYPGDAYVDYIGMDIYDQSWISGWEDPAKRWNSFLSKPYGLRWQRDFAAAHDKAMTYPEWGLAIRDDGHGGGDNPYFIQQMHDWIAANNVAFHHYFEFDAPDGRHRLMTGQFPRAADKFREIFSADPPPDPGDPPPAELPPTDTIIKHPRKKPHPKGNVSPLPRRTSARVIRGEVRDSAGGGVALRLQRRVGHRWRWVAVRNASVSPNGRFDKRLRAFRRGRLNEGVYRIRGHYRGTPDADSSNSRFRRFRIR